MKPAILLAVLAGCGTAASPPALQLSLLVGAALAGIGSVAMALWPEPR